MKTIEQYKKLLHNEGIIYFVKNLLRGALHIVKWNNLKKNFQEYDSYLYLKKYYKKLQYNDSDSQLDHHKTIWICWFQGLEQAPELVKKSVESVRTYCNEYKVVVLTHKNLHEYVNIPNYIQEKYENGIISIAHYSDVLRLILLIQHGGVWIDATVLLTEKIPKDILESDFFCYRATTAALSKIKASNWFIVSQPNNIILCHVRDMLFAYWKMENILVHYYLFHLCFAIVINKNAECSKIWSKVPNYSNYKNHLLQSELLNPFNQEIFNDISKETTVHKLTYKLQFGDSKKQTESFYDFIIKKV